MVLGAGAVAVGKKTGTTLPALIAAPTRTPDADPKDKNPKGKPRGKGGSLGLLAAVPGAIAAAGQLSSAWDSALVGMGRGSVNLDRLAASMTKTGDATKVTRQLIETAFADGAVGRHAADLGINVDKVTDSLVKAGTSGVTYRETLAQIDERMKTLVKAGDIGGEFQALSDLRKNLVDVGEATDKAGDQASTARGRQRALAAAMGQGSIKANEMSHALDILGRKKAQPRVKVDTSGVAGQIRYVQRLIDGVTGKTVGIRVAGKGGGGTQVAQADGGLLSFFGDGGIRRENHIAQIAPAGSWRVWAEPETGGEAYIPFAPSKRQRSREVAAEAVKMLGGRAEFYADGGVRGAGGATVRGVAPLRLVEGTLSIDENGVAYIKGLAEEVVAEESSYQGQLGRMNRRSI